MKFRLVFALLIFAMPLLAQDDAIYASGQLVDRSAPNSPFTFRGTVKCSEWVEGAELRSKADGSIEVINTSQRQVVAWAAESSLDCLHAGPHGVTTILDHFFKDHSIPEDNWTIPASFNQRGSESGAGSRKAVDILRSPASDPNFTVELTFVQFDDGSIWGSKDVFAQTQAKREAQRELLQQFQNLQQKSGAGAVIDRIREALQAAETRKSSGKF
jgi:hypothetical protein